MKARVFQGYNTTQIDGHTCEEASYTGWYWEPTDYDGDVLYSDAYTTKEAAVKALRKAGLDLENH